MTYDPAELVLSVRWWARQLAGDYAARRQRLDLHDDLDAALLAVLLDQARRGIYDPERATPTTWASKAAETRLPREFDALAWPVRIPMHVEHPDRGDDVRAAYATATAGYAASAYAVDPAEDRESPTRAVDDADEREWLERCLARLHDRERCVLRRHYGLDGEAEILRAIGEGYGFSVERTRQVRNRGLKRLRLELESAEARGPAGLFGGGSRGREAS